LDEDPRSEAAGRLAQQRIGCLTQVGEQSGGCVRISGQQLGKGICVQQAGPGRDVSEIGVPAGELGPADRPACRALRALAPETGS
jgi:hypothetical protein